MKRYQVGQLLYRGFLFCDMVDPLRIKFLKMGKTTGINYGAISIRNIFNAAIEDEGSITSNFLTNERFLKIKFVAISSKKL